MFLDSEIKLCVVGLGYVGLPLAIEFGKKFPTIGYDLNSERISELSYKRDSTNEISNIEFEEAKFLRFTNDLSSIAESNVYIVTVPTPIDENKEPDLSPLISASKAISAFLKEGDVVIYESTVYPGATEEICLPLLESGSNLRLNIDFYLGYSPERINPGDRKHKLSNILKVTSGSTPEVASFIDDLYSKIITAGTYSAESIKVAEAAKVIENTQRDLNIALINELSVIFNKLNIDTEQVLKAAETKWNFLSFRPGLVGGHCIGVDPYYLTHKAQSVGYNPEVILSGRKINDEMGIQVAENLINAMVNKGIEIKGSKILIMGICFKENCPDIRNSKVVDVAKRLLSEKINLEIHDPWADKEQVNKEYGLKIIDKMNTNYDAIVLAVGHDQYRNMPIKDLKALCNEKSVIYDLKYLLNKEDSDLRL